MWAVILVMFSCKDRAMSEHVILEFIMIILRLNPKIIKTKECSVWQRCFALNNLSHLRKAYSQRKRGKRPVGFSVAFPQFMVQQMS
jgi:hypothetical protein